MVNHILRIFFILIFVLGVKAQDISVKAFTDSSTYYVGDHINFTLKVIYSDNISIVNPFFRDSLNKFEIIKELNPEKKKNNNKNEITYKYVLSYYDSAEIVIPQIQIFYRVASDTSLNSVFSDSLVVRINKLNVNVQEDIKDVKPPVRIPFDWLTLLLWIFAGLLTLAIAYFIYKKYFRKKKSEEVIKPVIILPPHEEALMKLDQLDREQLWQKGQIKEYHSRITEIIREYFEKRFGLPALELSTTEQLSLLRQISEAQNIYNLTESFLTNADLVKFAKFVPLDGVNAEMMKQAVEIVKRTIPAKSNNNIASEVSNAE